MIIIKDEIFDWFFDVFLYECHFFEMIWYVFDDVIEWSLKQRSFVNWSEANLNWRSKDCFRDIDYRWDSFVRIFNWVDKRVYYVSFSRIHNQSVTFCCSLWMIKRYESIMLHYQFLRFKTESFVYLNARVS